MNINHPPPKGVNELNESLAKPLRRKGRKELKEYLTQSRRAMQ